MECLEKLKKIIHDVHEGHQDLRKLSGEMAEVRRRYRSREWALKTRVDKFIAYLKKVERENLFSQHSPETVAPEEKKLLSLLVWFIHLVTTWQKNQSADFIRSGLISTILGRSPREPVAPVSPATSAAARALASVRSPARAYASVENGRLSKGRPRLPRCPKCARMERRCCNCRSTPRAIVP